MSERWEPEEEQLDAPPERRVEEDAERYPAHEDPDAARERTGLDRHDDGEGEPERPPEGV